MFQVGDRVVCVDGPKWMMEKGLILTISVVSDRGMVGILEDTANNDDDGDWFAYRFQFAEGEELDGEE